MRISLLNAISQLVVFYGLFQRVNAAQVFLFSTIYQITWTLNFALNTQLAANQPDAAKRLMDDYGISQVFLFGSVFALVASLFVKKPPREDLALGVALPHLPITSPQVANNEIGLLASTLGTFLLFVCFMSITICFPVKSSRARYQWAEGYMNILFALCASVFTNMFVTHITKGKFGLREIHFGMIGGAIMAGPIAGTLDNPGAFMAIGTFAGLISALYYGFVHHKINRTRVYDTYGALFIFIVSFLGTFFIAPLVLIGMVRNEVTSVLLNNALITNGDVAGWSLVYVGISVGIAALSGLFIGLLLKCLEREVVREFDDENIFVPLPGLYDEAYVKSRIRVDDPYSQSASHLRGNAGI
jgi:ammonia channel protein AmtB